jgi:uncharacterized RDD family membrane protein YckC
MSETLLDYDASAQKHQTNATIGQRLGDKVLDYIAMYLISLALNPLLTKLFGLDDPQAFMDNMRTVAETKDFDKMYPMLLSFVGAAFFISFALKFLYYTCFEFFSQGKTLGKFATKTRVVAANGGELNLGHCLLRSLCRFIPFSFMSVFASDALMWHDKLSGTRVVQED